MKDSWQVFAGKLFDYQEADPLYYALARSGLGVNTQKRYVVAMFNTFYRHDIAGIAAQYQGEDFWAYLYSIYDTAPRASERRHFRGKAGLNALGNMREHFPHPEAMVDHLMAPTYLEVRAKVKALPTMLIGDYYIWKYADAQDCIFNVPCDFTGAAKFSSTVPAEGAALLCGCAPGWDIDMVYKAVVLTLAPRLAPPHYTRPCLLQEAETVCCFWHKQHMGKYYYGAATAKAYREFALAPNPVNNALMDGLTLGVPYDLPTEENHPWT